MRLLTHNLLCCVKCQDYPLLVEATDIAPADAPFQADFVRRMLGRLNYAFLVSAFEKLRENPALAMKGPLPSTIEEVDLSDESTDLREIHFALCAFAVRTGALVCSKCATRYPIADFVPNMLVE